ncbi:MAG: folylpolyglutamate synthase/dihydrofolate synthase family protein [Pirellulales bacterium]
MKPAITPKRPSPSAPPQGGPLLGDSAVDFLTSRIDYERMLSVPYSQRDFRLDRMQQLLDRLGNPHRELKIVHVTGTKGKGSTAAMIASVLRSADRSVGLFSSPHLDRVEERIAVNGQPCSAEDLARLVDRLRPAVAEMDAVPTDDPLESNRPTYFEIITALALLHFAERRVDAAVLEVGLGGRLDSTNVCQPLVSVITSISYDHTQQLGSTLAAIAGEKAGIIKPGVPVVSGVLLHEPRHVIAEAAALQGCRLVQLGQDFDFDYRPPRHLEQGPAGARFDFIRPEGNANSRIVDLELSLAGAHQAANAAVALATLDELRRLGWHLPEAAVRRGLIDVRWPARIEVVARRPTIVLDAAHNVASVEALVRVLQESFAPAARLVVFATTRDKDLRGMLSVLLPAFDEVIFTRYWKNPRGVPPEELASLAEELAAPGGPQVHVAADPQTAWNLTTSIATPEHLIAITGSFFIAAEMRAVVRGTVG